MNFPLSVDISLVLLYTNFTIKVDVHYLEYWLYLYNGYYIDQPPVSSATTETVHIAQFLLECMLKLSQHVCGFKESENELMKAEPRDLRWFD